MTAFSILGASGHAFANGIVTFGLMASSSALVIPVSLFVIGTRLWALGRRNGFMTPVQMFRDRWECGHIGTVIFAVQAVLLVPYIIIAVMGGGTTLAAVSSGRVPFWLGGAIVSLVVMGYVFFGGMRGTAWVNTFQTFLFLLFGAIAVTVIGAGMGGFSPAMEIAAASPRDGAAPDARADFAAVLLQLHVHSALVDRVSAHRHLLPDGAAALAFQEDVILYPICMLPSGCRRCSSAWPRTRARDVPAIEAKLEARSRAGRRGPGLAQPSATSCGRARAGDDVILRLVEGYAPLWLAALLGACVMAAVMASDSQILALSTMFTEDVFAFYGGKERFGEAVAGVHGPALRRPHHGRRLSHRAAGAAVDLRRRDAVRVCRLFGAVAAARRRPVLAGKHEVGSACEHALDRPGGAAVAWIQQTIPPPPPGVAVPVWIAVRRRRRHPDAARAAGIGLLPVVPMTLVSALLMIVVSRLTAGAPGPRRRCPATSNRQR